MLAAAGIEAATIIDGGAYVGDLTARYLDSFPRSHVWAFEPAPENFARLAARFRNEPRVTPVEAALAPASGEQSLSLNDADVTHSLLPLDPASPYTDYPVVPTGAVRVKALDLDRFCRDSGIERVNILKLDVQGFGGPVLRGAAGLLGAACIDLVFTEISFVPVYKGQTNADELLAALRQFGYRIFDLYNLRRSPSGQVKWGDALFLSPTIQTLAGI